jgi:cell wall-associated NlpC family hydrolase
MSETEKGFTFGTVNLLRASDSASLFGQKWTREIFGLANMQNLNTDMTGRTFRIGVGHARGTTESNAESESVTDILFNESVLVLQEQSNRARIRSAYDKIECWIQSATLSEFSAAFASGEGKTCFALGSFGYHHPDLRGSAIRISCGTAVYAVSETTVLTPDTKESVSLIQDASGIWFPKVHFDRPLAARSFVETASMFVGIPFVWGGKTSEGIDSSALVQVSLRAHGIYADRTSRDQSQSLGRLIGGFDQSLARRGDQLYLPDHVAIYLDDGLALHADIYSREVRIETVESIAHNRGLNTRDCIVRRVDQTE